MESMRDRSEIPKPRGRDNIVAASQLEVLLDIRDLSKMTRDLLKEIREGSIPKRQDATEQQRIDCSRGRHQWQRWEQIVDKKRVRVCMFCPAIHTQEKGDDDEK